MAKCFYCGKEREEEDLPLYDGNNLHSEDIGILPDDTVVCKDCLNRLFQSGRYFVCSDCGKIIDKEHTKDRYDGKYICQECAEDYERCADCGKYVKSSEMIIVYTANGVTLRVCPECLDTFYTRCEDCGRYYPVPTMYEERSGVYTCPECHNIRVTNRNSEEEHQNFNSNPNSPIVGYHIHHELRPIFMSVSEEDALNSPYLGVELEVDGNSRIQHGDRQHCASNIIREMPENFVYFENDGSMNCGGFECITQPATLAYHESLKDNYIKMFRVIREAGFRSHNTSSCGLHVHVNRNFFPPNDDEACVARMLYIMEHFWDNMVIFSRRKRSNIERWAGRYNTDVNNVAHIWKSGSDYLERYRNINLQNTNTFEFRIFRGTIKYNTFIATLQFVNNIVTTAKNKSIKYISNMEFEELINTPRLVKYWEEAQARVAPRNTEEASTPVEEPVSGDTAPDVEYESA